MKTKIEFQIGNTQSTISPLPMIYNIHVNQWLSVINERAFVSWLKFNSWCKEDGFLYQEITEDQVSSFSSLAKKLEIGLETLHQKVLKPLWNVGLIDIFEDTPVGNDKRVGEKFIRIKVYKFPQNKIELSFRPLEVCRDFDRDYKMELNIAYDDSSLQTIQQVLRKHKERLENDGIQNFIIYELFNYEKKLSDGLNEVEFTEMLDKALTHAKERIGSKGTIKGYFIAAIKRYKNRSRN